MSRKPLGIGVCILLAIIVSGNLIMNQDQATLKRSKMQSELDSVVLLLSKDARKLTPTQLDEQANRYFRTRFSEPEITDLKLVVELRSAERKTILNLRATGTYEQRFQFGGFPSRQIEASSSVI